MLAASAHRFIVYVIAVWPWLWGCGEREAPRLREIAGDGYRAWYRAEPEEILLRLDADREVGVVRVFGDGRVLVLRMARLEGNTWANRLEHELWLAPEEVDALARELLDNRRDLWLPGWSEVFRDRSRPLRGRRMVFRFARLRRDGKETLNFEKRVPGHDVYAAMRHLIESAPATLVGEPEPTRKPSWLGPPASEAPRLLIERGTPSQRAFWTFDRIGGDPHELLAEEVDLGAAWMRRRIRPRRWSPASCCCGLDWPAEIGEWVDDPERLTATADRVLGRSRPCVSSDGRFRAERLDYPNRFVLYEGGQMLEEISGRPIGWAPLAPVLYFQRGRGPHGVPGTLAWTPDGSVHEIGYATAFLPSPDGRRVAYRTGHDLSAGKAHEDRCLWTLALNAEGLPRSWLPRRRIACGVSSFDWSPDGRELVYAWTDPDELRRRISRRAVGAGPELTLYEVEAGGWFPLHPDWSPDGRISAFIRRWGNYPGAGPFHIRADPGTGDLQRWAHKDSVWVVGADGSDPLRIADGWAVRWVGERRGPWP